MRRLFKGVSLALAIAIMAPAVVRADDQETAQKVANSMRSSGRMKGYNVGVKVQDGTAWLNGTVANQEQMNTAVWIAQQTPGIERVVNNLAVGTASGGETGSSSGLRQPNSVAGGRTAPRERSFENANPEVQKTAMEMPEHARTQLAVGGAMPQYENQASMPVARQGAPSQRQDPRLMQGRMPQPQARMPRPLPVGAASGQPPYVPTSAGGPEMIGTPRPMPAYSPAGPGAPAPYQFDHPQMPGYAWPSYAAYPNYAAVTYPKQYSPTAWPYIGPFYPYPQVPLGWRKVTLEWDDGWWMLDFKDSH